MDHASLALTRKTIADEDSVVEKLGVFELLRGI